MNMGPWMNACNYAMLIYLMGTERGHMCVQRNVGVCTRVRVCRCVYACVFVRACALPYSPTCQAQVTAWASRGGLGPPRRGVWPCSSTWPSFSSSSPLLLDAHPPNPPSGGPFSNLFSLSPHPCAGGGGGGGIRTSQRREANCPFFTVDGRAASLFLSAPRMEGKLLYFSQMAEGGGGAPLPSGTDVYVPFSQVSDDTTM